MASVLKPGATFKNNTGASCSGISQALHAIPTHSKVEYNQYLNVTRFYFTVIGFTLIQVSWFLRKRDWQLLKHIYHIA
jgi:hypothetical protein